MQRLVATGRRTSRLANQLLALARAESAGTTGSGSRYCSMRVRECRGMCCRRRSNARSTSL